MQNEPNKETWAYNPENGEIYIADRDVCARVATVDLENCATEEQGHADGRMMAAARDLYKALEQYLDAQNATQIRTAQIMARDALAKAGAAQ